MTELTTWPRHDCDFPNCHAIKIEGPTNFASNLRPISSYLGLLTTLNDFSPLQVSDCFVNRISHGISLIHLHIHSTPVPRPLNINFKLNQQAASYLMMLKSVYPHDPHTLRRTFWERHIDPEVEFLWGTIYPHIEDLLVTTEPVLHMPERAITFSIQGRATLCQTMEELASEEI